MEKRNFESRFYHDCAPLHLNKSGEKGKAKLWLMQKGVTGHGALPAAPEQHTRCRESAPSPGAPLLSRGTGEMHGDVLKPHFAIHCVVMTHV